MQVTGPASQACAQDDLSACPICDDREGLLNAKCVDASRWSEHRVYECPACAGQFSRPAVPVGPEYYARVGPLRDIERRGEPSLDHRFNLFFDFMGDSRCAVLDAGCGDGGFIRQAQARGLNCRGFDYDGRVSPDARSLDDFVRDSPTGEFGAVTLFDFLEHVPKPRELMLQVKSWLKPGGFVFVTLPNAGRPLPWQREEHDYPPFHFTRWTRPCLRDFLERLGFEVLESAAGRLRLVYLADGFFYFVLMPRVIAFYKSLFFSQHCQDVTLSKLYELNGGLMSDKASRQNISDALRFFCLPVSYLVALLQWPYYKLKRRDCGDFIFVAARKNGT